MVGPVFISVGVEAAEQEPSRPERLPEIVDRLFRLYQVLENIHRCYKVEAVFRKRTLLQIDMAGRKTSF